jgi:hypothetical protein
VVAEEQMRGDLAHRRHPLVATHGQEELVLRSGEPCLLGLLLAPVEEPPEPVAERQQPAEVGIVERGGPA